MFSGIIEAVGTVAHSTRSDGSVRLAIESGPLDLSEVKVGDSVAVNGACLTVVAVGAKHLEFDVSEETEACTSGYPANTRINLERSLRFGGRLDGHLVTGHVDGLGTVLAFDAKGGNRTLIIEVARDLTKYIARKGSIAINGVSLTINVVTGNTFMVNVIPHTLKATNLGGLSVAAQVNIEVDIIARYCERILAITDTVMHNQKKP